MGRLSDVYCYIFVNLSKLPGLAIVQACAGLVDVGTFGRSHLDLLHRYAVRRIPAFRISDAGSEDM